MTAATTNKPAGDVAYLCRALKAPSMAAAVERLAERARSDGWTHEEFLAACLEREVAARAANGGELRIRAARFPARKSLDEFDYDHQRSLKRDVISHLGTLDFVAGRDNVVFLGPPGTGKTHLAIGLSFRACHAAGWDPACSVHWGGRPRGLRHLGAAPTTRAGARGHPAAGAHPPHPPHTRDGAGPRGLSGLAAAGGGRSSALLDERRRPHRRDRAGRERAFGVAATDVRRGVGSGDDVRLRLRAGHHRRW